MGNWDHLRGTWQIAHRAPVPKRLRADRPAVLKRRGDGALAIPALRLGEWVYLVVSREDTWAAGWNWFITKSGYAQRNVKAPKGSRHGGRTEYLHRLVYLRKIYPAEYDADGIALGAEPILEPGSGSIDHRNRRTLDNTRRNLALATMSEQVRNQHRNVREDVGVTWDSTRGRWMATIKHLGREHFVGRFRNRHAAIARRKVVLASMGLAEEPVPAAPAEATA